MATIRSFRALRPAPPLAEKIASVPYDVVNTKEARALAAGNDLSFLHVVRRGHRSARHHRHLRRPRLCQGRRELHEAQGFREPHRRGEPLSLYLPTQNGRAAIRSESPDAAWWMSTSTIQSRNTSLPARPKRMTGVRHMLTLRAHAGPVLLTYRRTEPLAKLLKSETGTEPLYDFTAEDGVQHTIWRCGPTLRQSRRPSRRFRHSISPTGTTARRGPAG